MQSSGQIVSTNKLTANILQAECLAACRPTNSVSEGKVTHSRTCSLLAHLGGPVASNKTKLEDPQVGLVTLSLTTKGSWLPWRRVSEALVGPDESTPLRQMSGMKSDGSVVKVTGFCALPA